MHILKFKNRKKSCLKYILTYVSSASNQDLSESFSQLCNYFRKTKQPKTKQNKKSTKPKETFYHGIRHYIYLLQYVVCLKILNIFSL